MKKIVSAVCTIPLVLLAGCYGYIAHFSAPVGIRYGGANEQVDKLIVICSDLKLRLAVENVLINRGIYVKSLETENVFKEEMEKEIQIDKYSFTQAITTALQQNGKVKGSEEFLKFLQKWNDLKDELERVNDYKELLVKKDEIMKKVYEFFNIDYILIVSKDNNTSYLARMINVKENRLVFTLYISGDLAGFDKIVPSTEQITNAQSNFQSTNLTDNQFFHIRFANYLVSHLLGSAK